MSQIVPSFDKSAAAQSIRNIFNSSASGFLEIGRQLLECKKHLKHGEWGPWLRSEFSWSERTARLYIQGYKKHGSNLQRVADSTGNLQITVRSINSNKTKKDGPKPNPTNHKDSSESKPDYEAIVYSRTKKLTDEIKRLHDILALHEGGEISRKLKLAEIRISSLEDQVRELEFIKKSYFLVKELIMESDPEYWFEIVKIIGKKKLYLG